MPKKSDRTKQRIIESANRLFYQQGYNRTSFSDVVEASGVPRGNIYYYFKSKEDILHATVDYRLERIKRMLEDWNGNYRTAIERLHRFISVLDDSANTLSRYGCPMGSLNAELGKDQVALKEKSAKLFSIFEDWLSDQFSELGYAGRARELALRFMAMGQGISMLTHVHNDPGIVHRERKRMTRWLDQLAVGKDDCI